MEEFAWIIFALGLGLWVGWHARGIWIIYTIAQHPELLSEIAQELKKIDTTNSQANSVFCTVEQVGDQTLVYEVNTGRFLGQGSSLGAALKAASHRFPGQQFRLHKPNENSQSS